MGVKLPGRKPYEVAQVVLQRVLRKLCRAQVRAVPKRRAPVALPVGQAKLFPADPLLVRGVLKMLQLKRPKVVVAWA